MDALQQLLDLEALKRLKADYIYHLDAKNWDAWLALFAPDATFQWDEGVAVAGQPPPPGQKFVGIAAITKITELMNTTRSVHRVVAPLLDLDSESTARGVWAMEDIVDFGSRAVHGYGHYRETYRKIGGTWKFSSVHLTRQLLSDTHR